MTERKKGFGPMGYRTRYRLENERGEVIAENAYLPRFIQLVEGLGYAKVGMTEYGTYEAETPNGIVTHPDPYQTPQPLFQGVEGPVRENFGRLFYKTKTIKEVTQ